MEYYEIAAKWWTDQLRDVKPSHFNVGDGLPKDGDLFLLLAGMQHANRVGPESEEALEACQKKLGEKIKERVERFSDMTLGVDYGPDKLMYDIAMETGIKGANFPLKTMMWISSKKVSVQKGYGKEIKQLFPVPKEKRKKGGKRKK